MQITEDVSQTVFNEIALQPVLILALSRSQFRIDSLRFCGSSDSLGAPGVSLPTQRKEANQSGVPDAPSSDRLDYGIFADVETGAQDERGV